MSAEDMVDAALVGLDQGERVTIPGLHNGDDGTASRRARRDLATFRQYNAGAEIPRGLIWFGSCHSLTTTYQPRSSTRI